MAGANNFLPFAQGGGANVLSQGAYLADAQRPLGNQPGVARSPLVNKALLQASAMSAGVAEFLAARQNTDLNDSLTAAQIAALMQNVFGKLTATANLYVATTGSDTANDGLAIGTPFRTIQHACDVAAAYNSLKYTVNVNIADGAYGEFVFITGPKTKLLGNVGSPGNVTTTTIYNSYAFGAVAAGITTTDAVNGITCEGGTLSLTSVHCPCQYVCLNAGYLSLESGNTLSSNQASGLDCYQNGVIQVNGVLTLTGTPAYSDAFARAYRGGVINFSAQPTGAATGSRYKGATNGVIDTSGGGANYLPGNAAGALVTGGQYN